MQPNVIVIHTDQHRQECLGAYGNVDVKTPNIDSITADGVIHTNHFCSYPICTPSRYSLLSGMMASAHRGSSNHCTLAQGLATFASELRKAGYRTAAVGKMHFTPTYLDVGFDTLVLAEQDGPGRFDDDYHKYLMNLGLLDEIDLYDQRKEYRKNAPPEYFASFGAKASDLSCEHHSTTYITNRALEQIDGFQEKGGNLLMAGYIKPHHPMDPPEPYASMYDPANLTILNGYTGELSDVDDKKSKGYFDNAALNEDRLRVVMSQYYGTITHIDDGVGRIIRKLKDKGLYDDALIIFTSDHGDYLGFRHLLLKGNYMYDPLMKIPLIIKYPASWRKTGVENALSSNIDVAKTILSVCGVPTAMSMQGLDLTRDEKRKVVIAEALCDYMVRTQKYKLLVSGKPKEYRLFDLESDPLETTDIAGDIRHKETIATLKDMLFEEMLLYGNKAMYLDYHAPVVNGKSPEQIELERNTMIAYMREKSSVKPHDD
jgi:arylsulfatase A-like enzyme